MLNIKVAILKTRFISFMCVQQSLGFFVKILISHQPFNVVLSIREVYLPNFSLTRSCSAKTSTSEKSLPDMASLLDVDHISGILNNRGSIELWCLALRTASLFWLLWTLSCLRKVAILLFALPGT